MTSTKVHGNIPTQVLIKVLVTNLADESIEVAIWLLMCVFIYLNLVAQMMMMLCVDVSCTMYKLQVLIVSIIMMHIT